MQQVSPINIPDPISQDFQRDVYCLLGLPVDNLTMESAKALLYDKAGQKGNVVLSTINRQTRFADGAFNGNKIAFINVDGSLAMVFRLFCIWESMYKKIALNSK